MILYMKPWTLDELERCVQVINLNYFGFSKGDNALKDFPERFDIVGGRIRSLRIRHHSVEQLKIDIVRALSSVSIEVLEDLSCVDVREWVPSACYSIIPVDAYLQN
ncbi:hypothetical protein ROZALSC1DRAFT_21988 [Rozella allomycis CSF55]|uniref:Uncharacterized protein n=1 Tax=Rozella allomycis (strain CSF55) TaxID=988480 RepID=A0A4P9YJK8_ROZAC|nr:hypothetical protein ROZALSC1DRAFT_21988 [Rozella allomycis CSF55]